MPRVLLALALAAVAALAVDLLAVRRGLAPPGFRDPRRRLLASTVLGFLFFAGVFFPALAFEPDRQLDLASVTPIEIFALQVLILGSLATWYALGFVGVPEVGARRAAVAWVGQLGLRARNVSTELAVGLAAGVVAWLGVLSAALLLGFALSKLGGERLLGDEPSELIVWMASLPVALRLGISLAAGVVEELFFRGFLQPRVGIALSTTLFVIAHLGYGQPFMLFGIALLSVFYAGLVAWRGSVWSAIAAHFFFDAVQLLVVIPGVLRSSGPGLLAD